MQLKPTVIWILIIGGIVFIDNQGTSQRQYVMTKDPGQPGTDTIQDSSAYLKSQVFYDSIYQRFSRKKVTRFLYALAFIEPKNPLLGDTVQVLQSDSPFEKFRNKTIRYVYIEVLPPFGASVYDTLKCAVTATGKTLNNLHMNTRKYVIRRNLLFQKGDCLDPTILADNERILRDMNGIDDARIVVVQPFAGSDTVDITVVAKDVWSLGIDVPLVTLDKTGFRIFDGNFLGLGDRITTNMSLALNRAPFFIFNGVSYTYANIAGSFIDAAAVYTADDIGQYTAGVLFNKGFITNQTRWAGGISTFYYKTVQTRPEQTSTINYSHNEGVWLGIAMPLKGQKKVSRAIVSSGFYQKYFSSRPSVTSDLNREFFNTWQVLTSVAISRNNYYITDYLLQFGKTENLSYGHLFELTAGLETNDFYQRWYSGARIGAGNYFKGFGFLSGFVKLGGFFHGKSFEDGVCKFNANYFTPLLLSKNHQFKFRNFLSIDYRLAFNSRDNNLDYFNANQFFKMEDLKIPAYFYGQKSLGVKISSMCFTPYYFYGFRFALMSQVIAGAVWQKNIPANKSAFFSGIGLSLIIKNDNLIFPPILISAWFYPAIQSYYNQFQLFFNADLNLLSDDFNTGAPHQETIAN
jgi:hypothetical protein